LRPTATQRGYDAKWRRIRAAFLKAHPYCEEPGCLEVANTVDHVDGSGPRGNNSWANLRAYCPKHHNRKTALVDGGFGKREPRVRERADHPGLVAPPGEDLLS
jgi:5-methylcytosine-specific restriction protein A